MEIIRLHIDIPLIDREYFYKVDGEIPNELRGYDSDRKLAEYLYNNDEELQRYYRLETIKGSYIDIFDSDDFKTIKF